MSIHLKIITLFCCILEQVQRENPTLPPVPPNLGSIADSATNCSTNANSHNTVPTGNE